MSCGVSPICGVHPRPPRPRVSKGLLVRTFAGSIWCSILELEGVCFGGVEGHWDAGLVRAPFTSRGLPQDRPPLRPRRLAVLGLCAFWVRRPRWWARTAARGAQSPSLKLQNARLLPSPEPQTLRPPGGVGAASSPSSCKPVANSVANLSCTFDSYY